VDFVQFVRLRLDDVAGSSRRPGSVSPSSGLCSSLDPDSPSNTSLGRAPGRHTGHTQCGHCIQGSQRSR
jgi:hypothetical protein